MKPKPHTTVSSGRDASIADVDPVTAALRRAGRDLATRTRAAQGLPAHVEDEQALAGLVELWERPRARRAGEVRTPDPVGVTAPTPTQLAGS